jgi:hypothetical protein
MTTLELERVVVEVDTCPTLRVNVDALVTPSPFPVIVT